LGHTSNSNSRLTNYPGPIVRIKPGVIHINDPEFIDQVYTGAGKRRDKTQTIANGLSTKHTALTTIDHYEHRRRRAILNPFFSKQSIRQLERLIHQAEGKVLHRLDMHAESSLPIKMNTLYNAVTQDIISDYCFGESTNSLDRDDLNEPFFKGIEDSQKSFHFDTYNPWFYDILRMLPLALITYLVPFAKVYLELAQVESAI
jgi:cytochrome P450